MDGQIGFLSEWQLYAQQLEGNTWKGEKMDKDKIDRMSGMLGRPYCNEPVDFFVLKISKLRLRA